MRNLSLHPRTTVASLASILATSFWATSCTGDVADDTGTLPPASSYLRSAHDCGEAQDLLSQALVVKMERTLARNRKAVESAFERECWEDDDDDEATDWEEEDDASGVDEGNDEDDDDDDGTPSDGNGDETPGDHPTDSSETNNQVLDVEEADFVQNDGKFIYILADNELQILSAWPPENLHTISRTPIHGEAKNMFVEGDRLLVYSSGAPIATDDPTFLEARYGGDCTYGYDCDFVGNGRALIMQEFDISKREAPVLIRQSEVRGSLLSARMVGDRVETVMVFPELTEKLHGIKEWPEGVSGRPYCKDDIPFTREEIDAKFEALRQANIAAIRAANLIEQLPQLSDTLIDPLTGEREEKNVELAHCDALHVTTTRDGTNPIVVASTSLSERTPYVSTTVLGRPGAVYATKESLYIASRHYRDDEDADNETDEAWIFDDKNLRDATLVHRFALPADSSEIGYLGSGAVKGRILNSFSLDEYENNLRIATTTGYLPSRKVHNTLSILAPRAGELATIGEIDNIAPGEDIRSVRFRGESGYIVTFKKTDPLFVLDLSRAEVPVIKGELKIPGFSTYMHPMDATHLLTIGYDADDQGDFAWFTGIQLQIIDVEDPSNPKLIHKEVIGTRGSTSDAATDHLAFNYYAKRNLLALPMVICEGPEDDIFAGEVTFNGLLVYDVRADRGFSRLGGLSMRGGDSNSDSESSGCGNWWTQGNSKVKRSVFMEDYVYAIAPERIRVARTTDLEHPLASVELVE
jgi:hypothetical protein